MTGPGAEPADPPPGGVPAATIAAQRVAEVRDHPQGRMELLRSSYAPLPGARAAAPAAYRRAALAFMGWQLRRGLLNPLDHERPGSPWWRAVNERLLRDTCEARSRLLGHPGPASSPSVEPSRPLRPAAVAPLVVPGPQRHDRQGLPRPPRPGRAREPRRALLHQPRPGPRAVRPRPRRRAPARTGLARADRPMARRSAAGHDRHVPLGVAGAAEPLPAGGRARRLHRRRARRRPAARPGRHRAPARPSCTAGRPTSCRSPTSPTSSATPRRPTRGIPTTGNPGRRHRRGSCAPSAGHSHPLPRDRLRSGAHPASPRDEVAPRHVLRACCGGPDTADPPLVGRS